MSEEEKNIDEFDLFDEEFSKEDVINRPSEENEEEDKSEDMDQISEFREGETLGDRIDVRQLLKNKNLEPDDFINYDDELRKKKNFRLEYEQSKEVLDREKRMQENFKDFLIARNITGKESLSQYKSRLPADVLKDSGRTVQIEDDVDVSEEEHEEAAKVVINRNENDEIESIDVYCTCGRKTKVEFDYGSYSKTDLEKEKEESILDFDRYTKNKEEMEIEFKNKKELIKQSNMREEDKERIHKNVPQTQMYENPEIDEMDDVIESKSSKQVIDHEQIASETGQKENDTQKQEDGSNEKIADSPEDTAKSETSEEAKDKIEESEKSIEGDNDSPENDNTSGSEDESKEDNEEES